MNTSISKNNAALHPVTLAINSKNEQREFLSDVYEMYKRDTSIPSWSTKRLPKTIFIDILAHQNLFDLPAIESRMTAYDASIPAAAKISNIVGYNILFCTSVFAQRILTADCADKRLLLTELLSSNDTPVLHAERLIACIASRLAKTEKFKKLGRQWRAGELSYDDRFAIAVDVIIKLAKTHDFCRVPHPSQALFYRAARNSVSHFAESCTIAVDAASRIDSYPRAAQKNANLSFVSGDTIVRDNSDSDSKQTYFDIIPDLEQKTPEEYLESIQELSANILQKTSGDYDFYSITDTQFAELYDILAESISRRPTQIAIDSLKIVEREFKSRLLCAEITNLIRDISKHDISEINRKLAIFIKMNKNLKNERLTRFIAKLERNIAKRDCTTESVRELECV